MPEVACFPEGFSNARKIRNSDDSVGADTRRFWQQPALEQPADLPGLAAKSARHVTDRK